MPDSKTPPPDGQDQTGAEVKKLKRSITLLWICVILQEISIHIISCRIDKIFSLLELFTEYCEIVTKVIERLVLVIH